MSWPPLDLRDCISYELKLITFLILDIMCWISEEYAPPEVGNDGQWTAEARATNPANLQKAFLKGYCTPRKPGPP